MHEIFIQLYVVTPNTNNEVTSTTTIRIIVPATYVNTHHQYCFADQHVVKIIKQSQQELDAGTLV